MLVWCLYHKKSCTICDPSSVLPCPSFLFSPFSSVIIQISSPALSSPLFLVCGVSSGLFVLPVARTPSCLRIPAALICPQFPCRKDEFQELLRHTMSSENEPAGSKESSRFYQATFQLESACYKQSFGKCQILVSIYMCPVL